MKKTDDEIASIARSLRRRCLMMCRGRGRGYAGQGLALADLMAILYFDHMNLDEAQGNVDRLILSTGHSAIAVFSALGELGIYTDEELAGYGQDGSRIEESPLSGLPGFPITGGSLGQGLSQAVGFALADRMSHSPARTYCIVSDGELQEGQIWEAAMSAGHYGLSNLVVLIDNNHMQADGDPAEVMNVEPVDAKFEAFGFDAMRVNGNSVSEMRKALDWAGEPKDRPSAIVCETTLGFGVSTFSNYRKVHYINLADEAWAEALKELS